MGFLDWDRASLELAEREAQKKNTAKRLLVEEEEEPPQFKPLPSPTFRVMAGTTGLKFTPRVTHETQ